MGADFPEADWKVLRSLKQTALDRYCERVMDECRQVIDDRNGSPHERYLRMFKLLQKRDDDLANAFNDLKRSQAVQRISWMRYLKLLTDEEWERFSPKTRDTVQFLAGVID